MPDILIKGAHARNTRAKLLLVPCTNPRCNDRDCPNHGYVVVELDGQREVAAEVRTRAEAFGQLQEFKKIPGVSPQPDFLVAIRQADWLTGEMPSALYTPAGTRKGDPRSRLKVMSAPLPDGVNLRTQGEDVDRACVQALKDKGLL